MDNWIFAIDDKEVLLSNLLAVSYGSLTSFILHTQDYHLLKEIEQICATKPIFGDTLQCAHIPPPIPL